MPQLAAALRKAGYGTTEERLRDVATEVLGVYPDPNSVAAQEALYARILDQADLVCLLFAPWRTPALKRCLILTDEQIKEQAPKPAKSHEKRFPQPPARPPATPPHFSELVDMGRLTPASLMLAKEEARRGVRREAQAAVGEVLRRSRLEMFMIDGRPLAALSVGAARGWALGRGREARWILLMTANMPADFIVGKQVSAEEAETYWRRARDDADE